MSSSSMSAPDTFAQSMFCLKRGGTLVTCGSTTGINCEINLFQLYQQQLRLIGSFGCSIRNLGDALRRWPTASLEPVIDSRIALDEIDAALARMESRQRLRQDHRDAVNRKVGDRPRRSKAKRRQGDHDAYRAEIQKQRGAARRLAREKAAEAGGEPPASCGIAACAAFGGRAGSFSLRLVADGAPGKDAYAAAGRVLRLAGPLTREHRLARANIAGAFPEMAPAERARILSQAWDHLGRASVEYAFLDDLVAAFDPDQNGKGAVTFVGLDQVFALRDGGRPSIMFAAHIGNWELPAALGAKMGLEVAAHCLLANPNVAAEMERRRRFIKKLVVSKKGAALQVARALRRGEHVGIIVDQRIAHGQKIAFLGRPSLSNPLVGVLARMFDLPVHPTCRAIRRPGGRFMVEADPGARSSPRRHGSGGRRRRQCRRPRPCRAVDPRGSRAMAVDARSLADVSYNAPHRGLRRLRPRDPLHPHPREALLDCLALQTLIEPPSRARADGSEAVASWLLVSSNGRHQLQLPPAGPITRWVVCARPKARGRAQSFFFWSPRSP